MGILYSGNIKRMLMLAIDACGGPPPFLQNRTPGKTPILVLDLIKEICGFKSGLLLGIIAKGFISPEKTRRSRRQMPLLEINFD